MPEKAGRSRPRVTRNPERTREAILQAALSEFSERGFGGARVDGIAKRSLTNKRMIYHYFGGKEKLYLAALERTYGELRTSEQDLRLESMDPEAAMRQLVRVSFRFYDTHPHFIAMLNTENLHNARILRTSAHIKDMHSPLVALIDDILERGHSKGVMRGDVDPVQLYISIAALGYFYFSNNATLSTIFDRNLMTPEAKAQREDHVVEMVMCYLRPPQRLTTADKG